MLDLYKLQIFAVVVQEGSFSRAAEQLYITQSAVSQHIKELEASLGTPLFQRGWRGVQPTHQGEILYGYTRDIFALVAQAENAVTDVEHLTGGRVSIGTTPGAGVYLAPDWVQQFRSRYPPLTVALQTGVTAQIVDDVLGRRLDIGVIEGELDGIQQSRLASLVLAEVEQKIVAGFKHAWWERDTIQIEELCQQSLIVRPANAQSRIWLEKSLHGHGIKPVIGAEFDNLEAMKRAVIGGMCLAVLPPYVFQTEAEQGLLRVISVEGRPLVRSLKLIWDKDTYFSPVTRAFLDVLSAIYPALKLPDQHKTQGQSAGSPLRSF